MRNWWYLAFGPPLAFYLGILLGPSSVLIASKPLSGSKHELACTYFTGIRTTHVREAHFCGFLHVLVPTDHALP
jgi:hypothetical protein